MRRQWDLLRRRWLTLPRPWQLAIVLGLVGSGAVATFYPRQTPALETIELFQGHNFVADELTQVEFAFASRGLTNFRIENGRVFVPKSQYGQYAAALKDGDAVPIGQNAIRDRMQSGSFLESDMERESRWNASKERLLENLLRKMDGIEEAFVMISRGKPRPFGLAQVSQPTMTVAVRSKNNKPLLPRTAYAICEAVSGAVDGLSTTGVTVTDLSTSNIFRGGSEQLQADERFARLKASYEQQWNDKVQRVLRFIPHAEVVTEVMMTQGAQLTSDGMDDHQQPSSAVSPASSPAWVPQRIAVTVSIPRDHLTQVWQKRLQAAGSPLHPPAPDDLRALEYETRQVVEQAVAGLAPLDGAVRLAPEARIIWFEPPAIADPVRVVAANRTSELLAQWLADPRILLGFLVLLAVVGFSLAWGVVRDVWRLLQGSPPTPAPVTELRVISHEYAPPARNAASATTSEPGVTESGKADAGHPGLTELVREDPQAAVSMLKNWLSKAG